MDILKTIKNKFSFLEGAATNKDEIAPAYINLKNPRYIEIDNMYYSRSNSHKLL